MVQWRQLVQEWAETGKHDVFALKAPRQERSRGPSARPEAPSGPVVKMAPAPQHSICFVTNFLWT